jgi:hypothetical protein
MRMTKLPDPKVNGNAAASLKTGCHANIAQELLAKFPKAPIIRRLMVQ